MPLSGHTFHDIHLHVNWHCLDDRPLLEPETVEPMCHTAIRAYCEKTRGATFLGVGGTETHVHLALSIEPSIAAADLIGKIKGASAHEVNRRLRRKALEWQRGYGVVSFGRKNLPAVLDYIANQKERHSKGKDLNEVLENWGARESGAGFGFGFGKRRLRSCRLKRSRSPAEAGLGESCRLPPPEGGGNGRAA